MGLTATPAPRGRRWPPTGAARRPSTSTSPSSPGPTKRPRVPGSSESDLDAIVRDLRKAKGVTFEHYDLPDTRREGDVHVSGETRVAWFKDPDGNILSLVNG